MSDSEELDLSSSEDEVEAGEDGSDFDGGGSDSEDDEPDSGVSRPRQVLPTPPIPTAHSCPARRSMGAEAHGGAHAPWQCFARATVLDSI